MIPREAASYEPDIAARTAVLAAVVWVVLATGMGFLLELRLLYPDVLPGVEALSYGRLRPLHDIFAVFGWLTVAGFAAVFSIVPRLARAGLHNEVLGSAVATWWTVVLLAGAATLVLGMSQGRPLAELPIGVDVVLVVLLLLFAWNVGMTVTRRREKTLYASAWYLLAAIIWLPIIYVAGNLSLVSGVVDLIVSGFYVHSLMFLWLVPVGLGIAHYVVPDATGNALHSRQLALVSFWSLAALGGWAGQRLFIWGPGPDYLETISIAMAAVLLVPVLSAASNLFATGKGRWGLVADDYGLRFVAVGMAGLVAWTALIGVSAHRPVARVLGLTPYQSGVDHLAIYGVFSAFAFGMIYHMYPRLVGRSWYSSKLSSLHFWMTVGAAGAGGLIRMAHGLMQGESLLVWSRTGEMAGFADVWQQLALSARAYHALGAVAFAVLAAAQLVLVYNVWMTSRRGEPLLLPETVPVATAGSRV